MLTETDIIVNRFAVAAQQLLMHELEPEFANDDASVLLLVGHALDPAAISHWTLEAQRSDMDLIYLAFEKGRERFGPVGASIFAKRGVAVYRWLDCELWAPKDGGPLLVMPRGINVCFGHDGRALISLPTRPTRVLTNGIARARKRLMAAARRVTAEQVAAVDMDMPERRAA